MVVRTVGMIKDPIEANNIIVNQDADMVAMARAFLSNPRWVWDAAKVLNHDIEVPHNMPEEYKLFYFFLSVKISTRDFECSGDRLSSFLNFSIFFASSSLITPSLRASFISASKIAAL